MTLNGRQLFRHNRRATMVAFVAAAMLSVPLALAQLPPGSPQRTNPGMNATQEEVLAKEIAGLRSRLAQLQTVLGQRYPSGRYEVGVMPVGMPMEKQMGICLLYTSPSPRD